MAVQIMWGRATSNTRRRLACVQAKHLKRRLLKMPCVCSSRSERHTAVGCCALETDRPCMCTVRAAAGGAVCVFVEACCPVCMPSLQLVRGQCSVAAAAAASHALLLQLAALILCWVLCPTTRRCMCCCTAAGVSCSSLLATVVSAKTGPASS